MFNNKEFMNAKLSPRTEEVNVKELKDWFSDNDPIWTVNGLSHKQLAIAEERSTGDGLNTLVDAMSGNNKEQADAIRKLVGLDKGVPKDTAKRLELLVAGSVNPEIELDIAIKLATNFPTVFVQLTNTILQLTGLGSEVKVKPKPSGKESTSKTV